MVREVLERLARPFGLAVDAEGAARLARYLEILTQWNRRLRLTGERDLDALVEHHVADSLACAVLPRPGDSMLDVGTGAGFPGLVAACVRPDVEVTLLDSRQRPISFLGEVSRLVPLPNVHPVLARAEVAGRSDALRGRQSVVVSRALRMAQFFPLARPFLASTGIAVSMQTPAVSRETAAPIAERVGLEIAELRDYVLPDGTPRRLVICRPK